MLGHPIPPHLVTLTLKGIEPDTTRIDVFAAHFPTTLRRIWLDAVKIGPGDIGMLVHWIPRTVRDLSLVHTRLRDDAAEALALVILPNLTHLRLVPTGMTQRGLMAVIVALPADQLVSLTLSSLLHTETATALAAWLARTTRLARLGLHHTHTIAATKAIDLVLAALPSTLRSLELPGSLSSASSLAIHLSRVRDLELLDVSEFQGQRSTLAAVLPAVPDTLQVLRMAYIDFYETDVAEMLIDVGRPWLNLVKLDLRGPRPRVLVKGNMVSMQKRAFWQIQERWAENGWDLVS
ncbi:hypothetical protein GGF32_000582 [Allomyces javanicus]|nr:hypothetical protein GGF32_000582 [Allomyces javanicus]